MKQELHYCSSRVDSGVYLFAGSDKFCPLCVLCSNSVSLDTLFVGGADCRGKTSGDVSVPSKNYIVPVSFLPCFPSFPPCLTSSGTSPGKVPIAAPPAAVRPVLPKAGQVAAGSGILTGELKRRAEQLNWHTTATHFLLPQALEL